MNFGKQSCLNQTNKALFNLILQQINQNDFVGILASISDKQWLHSAELQLALLQDNELINRLVDIPDKFIQFATFRLIKTILLSSVLPLHESWVMYYQMGRSLIQGLFQRLINTHSESEETQRAVLELFHELLKHHRHLVRHLNEKQDNHSSNHVAIAVMEEMASPAFWTTALDSLLSMADAKFSTLVLLVDIEKARFLSQNNESFGRLIAICHSYIIDSINQLLVAPQYGPHALRKLFELLSLTLKSTYDEGQDLDRILQLNLQVVTALSPVTLRVMLALSSIDPQLEHFSSRSTGFIFAENPAYSGIDKELQPLVSNPEAIRQLGHVFLTAVLSILDTLTLMARDTNLGNQPGYNNRRSENLAQMRSFILATLGFVRSWIGPDTLELILKIYGEDDAGVSWLLMTMSQIEHRFRDMRSKYYQFISEALLVPDEFDDMHNHLFEHVHPLEALFKFLESIGYDYQTLLDLLLTLDDQQTGGMLAAMMAILRNFIENESDQRKLTERWKRVMARADEMMRDFSDDLYKVHRSAVAADLQSDYDDKNFPNNHEGPSLERRAILFGVEFGISQLAHHIRHLHEKHLFPYNPRALLVVLDRTQHILLSVISNSSK